MLPRPQRREQRASIRRAVAKPPGEGPFRNAELPGRFLTGLALQFAENDGLLVLVGQPTQLPGEEWNQFTPTVRFHSSLGFGHRVHLPLPGPPPGRSRFERREEAGKTRVSPLPVEWAAFWSANAYNQGRQMSAV
jgi:hypothetical protein